MSAGAAAMRGGRSFWERLLFWRGRKAQLPGLHRNHTAFRFLDLDQPLSACDFVVLDTELTGLRSRKDAIVSIGAVRLKNLRIVPGETWYRLVKPSIALPKRSTLIHRITPQDLAEQPDIADVLPDLIDFCSTSLIVGHCVGLDMEFINRVCRRLYGGALRSPSIDTLRMALLYQEELWENNRERYRFAVSYTLNDLSERYGLPLFEQHNALNDALQTAYLFLFLCKKLRQGGIETLRQLYDAGRAWRFA